MDYRKMTTAELHELEYQLVARGNLNAAQEVHDFMEVYGKRVKVIKGRKVPHGTEGEVFWVKRYDNSKYGDPWGIYSVTKVGIRDDAGEAHFTAIGNVEIMEVEK